MNKSEFVDLIVKNHNSGKWLNCTECVEINAGQVVQIGVKAFAKWVQVMQINGMRDGSTAQKTVKEFRVEVKRLVDLLLKSNGYEVNE